MNMETLLIRMVKKCLVRNYLMQKEIYQRYLELVCLNLIQLVVFPVLWVKLRKISWVILIKKREEFRKKLRINCVVQKVTLVTLRWIAWWKTHQQTIMPKIKDSIQIKEVDFLLIFRMQVVLKRNNLAQRKMKWMVEWWVWQEWQIKLVNKSLLNLRKRRKRKRRRSQSQSNTKILRWETTSWQVLMEV